MQTILPWEIHFTICAQQTKQVLYNELKTGHRFLLNNTWRNCRGLSKLVDPITTSRFSCRVSLWIVRSFMRSTKQIKEKIKWIELSWIEHIHVDTCRMRRKSTNVPRNVLRSYTLTSHCDHMTTISITYLRSSDSTHDEHKNPRSSKDRFSVGHLESRVTEKGNSRENELRSAICKSFRTSRTQMTTD